MSEWKKFIAICIAKDGSIVIVSTKKSLKNLKDKKFQRIILGKRAIKSGQEILMQITDSLTTLGQLESWDDTEVIYFE